MEATALTRELERVTGVRSSTPTYYTEYRRTSTELARAIGVLASLPSALRMSWMGPEALAELLVASVARALDAEWVALATTPDSVDTTLPDLVARRADGGTVERLPADVTAWLDHADRDEPQALADHRVAARLRRDGRPLAALIASFGRTADRGDLALLEALALQAAVALENAELYRESERLREQQAQMHRQADRHSRRLAERGAELYRTQRSLVDARARQLLERERARIARELHDTVAQHLLGIGMQLEWCRPLIGAGEIADRLTAARELARSSVMQIRQAIYELSSFGEEGSGGLADALHDLAADVGGTLVSDAHVTVRGRSAELPITVEHGLLRIAQEAVFNAARHACAQRISVRLTYLDDAVRLSVIDDGRGDAAELRRRLRDRDRGDHYGLRNMSDRAHELGASLQLRRAAGGGVAVSVRLPLDAQDDVA